MSLAHEVGLYEERISYLLDLKARIESINVGEEITIILEVSNKKYTIRLHNYTINAKNLQDLVDGRQAALDSFKQRFGTYITHFKDGQKIKKNDYSKAFDDTASELGMPSGRLDRTRKNIVKQALSVKGYSLGIGDRWTDRGWNEVRTNLEVIPKDEETVKKFINKQKIISQIDPTKQQVENLKKRILKTVLAARGKKANDKQFFTIHYWRGYRVISVFEKGRRGLVTRIATFNS